MKRRDLLKSLLAAPIVVQALKIESEPIDVKPDELIREGVFRNNTVYVHGTAHDQYGPSHYTKRVGPPITTGYTVKLSGPIEDL